LRARIDGIGRIAKSNRTVDNCGMSPTTYDVAIIGGGHNGLTAAAYLARGGLRVVVLEANAVVGGAAITEEFAPGFRNSVASYTVSLLNPKVIRDLELTRHGLTIVERPAANYWPLASGAGLLMPYGLAARQAAIAPFSAKDAARLPDYDAALERAASVLRGLLLQTPPNDGGGLLELIKGIGVGRQVLGLPLDEHRVLLDLFTKSAASFLEGWFESDMVRAAFAFDGIVGAYASPYTPGTAYVLLHHCFGEVNGRLGVWGHALGGMGAISEALATAARTNGAEIRTGAVVARVDTSGPRVTGVTLATGEQITARAIASNVAPKVLMRDLVPASSVDDQIQSAFAHIETGSGTFRMNVALSELPIFSGRPTPGPHHGAGIIIGPTMDYMDRAYSDARRYGWSSEPVIEMLIPSTLDPSLAPPGRHVASLFVQHVAPRLPVGRSWDNPAEARAFADLVIATVNRYAPNFAASVLHRQTLSPRDLERRFGLPDGDIFHGQLGLGQLFSARPVLGYANYRAPLKGLYFCGSGAHPGGGVTGVPGHNAASEILRDFKRWRGGHLS
jgi:phytoene dehydrogenase-like protein